MWDACKLLWSLFLGLFRTRASLEAENLALRQQIIVLQRTAPKRLRFNTIDRMIFVGPYQLFPDLRDALAVVRTRDRHSLAPRWVQSLLAMEIKASSGKTEGAA
jgi:hypothetical protein